MKPNVSSDDHTTDTGNYCFFPKAEGWAHSEASAELQFRLDLEQLEPGPDAEESALYLANGLKAIRPNHRYAGEFTIPRLPVLPGLMQSA
jgi:hypothetical protein